jgi:hypothetical protein
MSPLCRARYRFRMSSSAPSILEWLPLSPNFVILRSLDSKGAIRESTGQTMTYENDTLPDTKETSKTPPPSPVEISVITSPGVSQKTLTEISQILKGDSEFDDYTS